MFWVLWSWRMTCWMLGAIQQLCGPNVAQCWPSGQLWTFYTTTIYSLFTWPSMYFLLTIHLPLLVHIVIECPLKIILIYLFNQVSTKTNKQTNLDCLINSIILSVAFHFFIYPFVHHCTFLTRNFHILFVIFYTRLGCCFSFNFCRIFR